MLRYRAGRTTHGEFLVIVDILRCHVINEIASRQFALREDCIRHATKQLDEMRVVDV